MTFCRKEKKFNSINKRFLLTSMRAAMTASTYKGNLFIKLASWQIQANSSYFIPRLGNNIKSWRSLLNRWHYSLQKDGKYDFYVLNSCKDPTLHALLTAIWAFFAYEMISQSNRLNGFLSATILLDLKNRWYVSLANREVSLSRLALGLVLAKRVGDCMVEGIPKDRLEETPKLITDSTKPPIKYSLMVILIIIIIIIIYFF